MEERGGDTIPVLQSHFPSPLDPKDTIPDHLQGAVCLLKGAGGMAGRFFQAAAGRSEGRWKGSPFKAQPTKSGWLFTKQPPLCPQTTLTKQPSASFIEAMHAMG